MHCNQWLLKKVVREKSKAPSTRSLYILNDEQHRLDFRQPTTHFSQWKIQPAKCRIRMQNLWESASLSTLSGIIMFLRNCRLPVKYEQQLSYNSFHRTEIGRRLRKSETHNDHIKLLVVKGPIKGFWWQVTRSKIVATAILQSADKRQKLSTKARQRQTALG